MVIVQVDIAISTKKMVSRPMFIGSKITTICLNLANQCANIYLNRFGSLTVLHGPL